MKDTKFFVCTLVLLLIATCMMGQVDARRKILKGRRTITRTYYKAPALPPWAIILLVSIGELLVGGVAFVIMKKLILDPTLNGAYSPPPLIKGP